MSIKLIGGIVAGLIALVAVTAFFDYEKVPAGHVGIKYNLYGGDKGVNSEELPPGRYILGPNEELYLFPTFTQTYVWTKEPVDGDATDESIAFQDREGLRVEGDIGITYSVNPAKVTDLFQKYRRGIEEITDVFLRNIVRDSLVKHGSSRDAEEIYGPGKEQFLKVVEEDVRAQVAALGITVERVYSTGAFRLHPSIVESINNKIKATQIAQQKENELKQSQAEAEKARAVAAGEKDAAILKAQGKAEALNIEGEALRRNPGIAELRAIEAWNGQLPQYVGGGAIPFVQIPQTKL
jgi:regulator of protease activity HflC (stomatin/prohibitin superfamily)